MTRVNQCLWWVALLWASPTQVGTGLGMFCLSGQAKPQHCLPPCPSRLTFLNSRLACLLPPGCPASPASAEPSH